MSESKKNEMSHEMESLNLEELDIEELEHRLELAAAGTSGLIDGCSENDGGSGCTTDCTNNTNTCVGLCTNLCGANCPGNNNCYVDVFLTGGNTI